LVLVFNPETNTINGGPQRARLFDYAGRRRGGGDELALPVCNRRNSEVFGFGIKHHNKAASARIMWRRPAIL
jgi:hypothetical protein